MKLTILCEKDEEGHFVMECAELPGCLSEGYTLEEALESINEAIAGCITSRIKTATHTLLNKTPDSFSFSLKIPGISLAYITPGIRKSPRFCFQTGRMDGKPYRGQPLHLSIPVHSGKELGPG